MILRHIYHKALAQASYLVGCAATGEALVVDPNRDLAQYSALAEQEGLRITAVTETHMHADFVSGARELAHATGARLLLSDAGPVPWKYSYAAEAGATLLHDGDSFMVGNVRLDVLHTPGHTPEHLSFLVTDTAGANEPMGIFTGDFVFVGDVGRPDLLETAVGLAGTMDGAARQLFHSLEHVRTLTEYLQVWPGHGAGSACGRALGAVPQSTIGYEKRTNWAFGVIDEDKFVAAVLDGQPTPPPYFAHMKQVNKAGPALLESVPDFEQLGFDTLLAERENGTLVIDLRSADAYAAGHIPGTINLPFNGSFLTWAGWLLPYAQPLAFVADAVVVAAAVQQLRLIGLDGVAGYWTPDVLGHWEAHGMALETTSRIDMQTFTQMDLAQVTVLDVRQPHEYAAGHIAGSRNVPLQELQCRIADVPADRPVVVHCQGGARSALATSLLQAQGRTNVIDLLGGFGAWAAHKQAVVRS